MSFDTFSDVFRIRVPYIAQTQLNSCGAASLGMLLGYQSRAYQDRAIPQTELIQMLQIDAIGHTCKKALRNALTSLGVEFAEFAHECGPEGTLQHSSLEKMLEIVDSGDPAMINYAPTPEGHYAVVVGYTEQDILVHDPEHGPNRRIAQVTFDQMWVSGNGRWKKWFLVVC